MGLKNLIFRVKKKTFNDLMKPIDFYIDEVEKRESEKDRSSIIDFVQSLVNGNVESAIQIAGSYEYDHNVIKYLEQMYTKKEFKEFYKRSFERD